MQHIFEQNAKWSPHICPASASAATNGSAWLDLTEYGLVAFHLIAAAGASNVVCALYQATDSGGTSAKTCTNGPQSGVATLTGDGSTCQDDVIEITDRDLDVANSFTHVRMRMTPAGAMTICCSAVRSECRHPDGTMPS